MEYRRQVAMRCDGEEFVIAIQSEDEIVFRTKDARALRNLCRRLRWQIAITSLCRLTIGLGRRTATALKAPLAGRQH